MKPESNWTFKEVREFFVGVYDRRTQVIWSQSPIYGPCTATEVWILRYCEVAEMEARITRSLAGMGIDFDRDGDGRGGKARGTLPRQRCTYIGPPG